MTLAIEVRGGQVWRRVGEATGSALPDRSAGAAGRLEDWAARYGRAVVADSAEALLQIGLEMLDWLDTGGALRDWLGRAECVLEVRADPLAADPLEAALLAAPWELLARDGFHLAQDARRSFIVARRCADGQPAAPAYADLSLLFMAALPGGQNDLGFEAEEAAILEATRPRTGGAPLVHLTVEESGSAELMGERCRLDGPFEAVHLSCHGDILRDDGAPAPLPILALETEEGDADHVAPTRLKDAFGRNLPPLLFLSACRTAERGAGQLRPTPPAPGRREQGLAEAPAAWADRTPMRDAGGGGVATELAEPYALQLALAVPNVLGWDGSVYDVDASKFAEVLYGELARGETVTFAAARARRALFEARTLDPRLGRHWHLARVYLGPGGGGALCDPRLGNPRPGLPEPEVEFLDPTPGHERVPVAKRTAFVGRRRQLQQILRAYRSGTKGVLIHGIGKLGKSSLAARVAGRMTGHRTVVVFGAYHALAICQDIARAAQAIADRLERPAAEALMAEIAAMERAVTQSEAALEGELRRLLHGAFRRQPILLIVDDLEKALETPTRDKAVVEVRPDLRPALLAVLGAFAAAEASIPSRLLVTSRFDFALPDAGGRDLAAMLVRVQPTPMPMGERRKQFRAKVRAEQQEATAAAAPSTLVEAALAAASGNPGLQEILTRPILGGETAAAEAAIAAVQRYLETGEHPEEGNAAQEFFAWVSFKVYADALTPTQKLALGAAALFDPEVPIPRPALAAAASALGVADADAALARLLALGLLDDWGTMRGWADTPSLPHAAINTLARPLAATLSEADRGEAAAAALVPLATAWRGGDGNFPRDLRGVAACRLALEAAAVEPAVLEAAALAAVVFLFRIEQVAPAALALAVPALERLAEMGHAPGALLLGHTIKAAEQAGETALQDKLLTVALAMQDLDPATRAGLQGLRADRLRQLGELDQALAIRQHEQLPVYEALGDKRSLAVTKGKIADILEARGEVDQALAIRQQDELPVYEALGDKRSLAVTKGQIADILQARGELDQALAIREQDELPVYEALGDKRSLAVAKGRIADILEARGELDQALAIRQQEQLPVYEALGDKRSLAVAKGRIADILQARGELDQALAIRQQDELPVYEALGDKRSLAVTKGQIADILRARGELDQALAIRQQEQLPVYEALGDKRSLAVTKGKIADILQARGELDAALATWREVLPVFEALGDKRSLAVTKGQIADILQARGELDQALAIRQQEVLPVFEALGDKRSLAVAKGKIADILEARGELDQALAIRQQEQLPVFEALGDKRELAVTKGRIADILAARGELDQALATLQEVLPVFEALGDKRSLAVAKGKIADILQARGELDQALATLQEVLPVFEALGDKRSLAVTKGKIADILEARGELDQALATLQEVLPVFEALGDKRELAVTKGKIADILQARGELDQALAIRRQDELPVYEALGDKRSLAVAKGKIADILQARGELDQALALHLERLPVATEMRDLDSLAHIRFCCAQIRLQRGDHESGGLPTIADELSEAWEASRKLGRVDFIGGVGWLLGQVLAMGGRSAEAVQVLETAAAGWEKLGQVEQAAQCRALAAQISGGGE